MSMEPGFSLGLRPSIVLDARNASKESNRLQKPNMDCTHSTPCASFSYCQPEEPADTIFMDKDPCLMFQYPRRDNMNLYGNGFGGFGKRKAEEMDDIVQLSLCLNPKKSSTMSCHTDSSLPRSSIEEDEQKCTTGKTDHNIPSIVTSNVNCDDELIKLELRMSIG